MGCAASYQFVIIWITDAQIVKEWIKTADSIKT